MSQTDGQTLGKRLTGVRVVRTDGRAMGSLRPAWREVAVKSGVFGALFYVPVAAAALVAPWVVFLDYLWPLWDRRNRSLHDWLAGTRVVRA